MRNYNCLFTPLFLLSMNRIRSISIASDVSNPGIRFSSSGIGVVTGDVVGEAAGVSAGDTAGEGVAAGERVGVCAGIGVVIEVANFSFHAFIPPSIL